MLVYDPTTPISAALCRYMSSTGGIFPVVPPSEVVEGGGGLHPDVKGGEEDLVEGIQKVSLESSAAPTRATGRYVKPMVPPLTVCRGFWEVESAFSSPPPLRFEEVSPKFCDYYPPNVTLWWSQLTKEIKKLTIPSTLYSCLTFCSEEVYASLSEVRGDTLPLPLERKVEIVLLGYKAYFNLLHFYGASTHGGCVLRSLVDVVIRILLPFAYNPRLLFSSKCSYRNVCANLKDVINSGTSFLIDIYSLPKSAVFIEYKLLSASLSPFPLPLLCDVKVRDSVVPLLTHLFTESINSAFSRIEEFPLSFPVLGLVEPSWLSRLRSVDKRGILVGPLMVGTMDFYVPLDWCNDGKHDEEDPVRSLFRVLHPFGLDDCDSVVALESGGGEGKTDVVDDEYVDDMDLMSIYGADEDDAEALEVDSDDNDLDYYDGRSF